MTTTEADLVNLVQQDPYGDKGLAEYHYDQVGRSESLREVPQTASAVRHNLTPERQELFLAELSCAHGTDNVLPVLRKWWRWAVLCANPQLRLNTPGFLRKLANNDESVFDDIPGFPAWCESSDSD